MEFSVASSPVGTPEIEHDRLTNRKKRRYTQVHLYRIETTALTGVHQKPWEDPDKLREAILRSTSWIAVADELGCTPQRAKAVAAEHGINEEPQETWEDEETVRNAIQTAETWEDVGSRIGCSADFAQTLAEGHGIEVTPGVAPADPDKPWRDPEKLERVLSEVPTVGDAARELGCSPGTVENWADKYGLELPEPAIGYLQLRQAIERASSWDDVADRVEIDVSSVRELAEQFELVSKADF